MESVNSVVLIPKTMARCYDVDYGGRRYLIDAGTKGSGRKIISYYNEIGAKPIIILITHYHPDHIGGLKSIYEAFGPKIYVPDKEIDVVRGKKKMEKMDSIVSRLIPAISRIDGVESVMPVSSFKSDGIEIVDSGGHTPDSRSYKFTRLNALFTGDSALMKRDGIGFSNTFTLDHGAAQQSLEKIMNIHGITCYPGHGPTFRVE